MKIQVKIQDKTQDMQEPQEIHQDKTQDMQEPQEKHQDKYCRNLPLGRRATRNSRVSLPREEGAWSRHQHLFKENVEKTETCGLRTLSVKGSRVIFTHGEGISTPHDRHKGR